MKKQTSPKKRSKTAAPAPSPYDDDFCWQCNLLITPELGEDMRPTTGGYCTCKGWRDNIYVDACELFQMKKKAADFRSMGTLYREIWEKINRL